MKMHRFGVVLGAVLLVPLWALSAELDLAGSVADIDNDR